MKKHYYIDTLYLAWNIKELHLIDSYETLFFNSYGAEYIGTANGYNWFNTPIGRFGIIDNKDNVFIAKLPAFVLQYNNKYLLDNTIDNVRNVVTLDTLVLPAKEAIVRRVDFSIITQDVRYFDMDIVSRVRTKTVMEKNGIVETVYLGKRAGGKVFRYYRKDLELLQDKNLAKKDYFAYMFSDIDFNAGVTVLELELHRKFLRDKYNYNYLQDIDTLISIVNRELENYKFYEPTDKNIKFVEQNNYSLIDYLPILQFPLKNKKEVVRVVKTYRPSFSLLYSRLNKIVTNYIDSTGVKISKSEVLLNVFNKELELQKVTGMELQDLIELQSEDDLFLIKVA